MIFLLYLLTGILYVPESHLYQVDYKIQSLAPSFWVVCSLDVCATALVCAGHSIVEAMHSRHVFGMIHVAGAQLFLNGTTSVILPLPLPDCCLYFR
jgi:hypothetical protein